MRQPQRPGPRVPEVNLFSVPRRSFTPILSTQTVELVLIALVVIVWVMVGVGIALLFGWRPPVGVGT